MPLAKLCVSCHSRLEREKAHQSFAEERISTQPLITKIAEEEMV